MRHNGLCVSPMRHNQRCVSLCAESETQAGADDYAVAMRLAEPPNTSATCRGTPAQILPSAWGVAIGNASRLVLRKRCISARAADGDGSDLRPQAEPATLVPVAWLSLRARGTAAKYA